MKNVLVSAIVALSLVGCASVQGLVDKVVPKIEVAAGKGGVRLSVNETELVSSTALCLEADGKVASVLLKVPFLGQALVGAIGVCAPEAPAPADQPVN